MAINLSNWKDLAELVGIAAIVASLVFVGLQMQQAREIALSESHLARAESNSEMAVFRAQNVEIWLKGNSGDELTFTENAVYEEMLRSYWREAFWTTMAEREIDFGRDISLHDFAAFLSRNPGARKRWEEWHNQIEADRDLLIEDRSQVPDILAVVRQSLQKLDRTAAQ